MDDKPDVPFLGQFCSKPECRKLFWICRPCYRGQRYCSEACRVETRLKQRTEYNRRHQQSEEGRLDHCDRQKAYRQRQHELREQEKQEKSVTDQGRFIESSSVKLNFSGFCLPSNPIEQADLVEEVQNETKSKLIRCSLCGRTGIWVKDIDGMVLDHAFHRNHRKYPSSIPCRTLESRNHRR